jgi:hypothetical protein
VPLFFFLRPRFVSPFNKIQSPEKGFTWNRKRVYRIYLVLELNLRIKPRKRLVREKSSRLPCRTTQPDMVEGLHGPYVRNCDGHKIGFVCDP